MSAISWPKEREKGTFVPTSAKRPVKDCKHTNSCWIDDEEEEAKNNKSNNNFCTTAKSKPGRSGSKVVRWIG